MPRLKDALADAGNWVGQLPDAQHPLVTLRAVPAGPTVVLLHPLGTLTVKQTVVPLDIDISRFGPALPPAFAASASPASASADGTRRGNP